MSKEYNIAVIRGDGIGPEVIEEGIKVLNCVCDLYGIKTRLEEFPWGSDYFLKTGKMYDDAAFDILSGYDAILLGAVGDPKVPDSIAVRLVIDLRFAFDQYINLRPIKRFKGAPSFLKDGDMKELDFCVVRENTEGEYCNAGGRFKIGTADETVLQTSIFTRKGTERVIRYAFELAMKRSKEGITKKPHVTNCTKSNAMKYSMVFWDEIFEKVAIEYPSVGTNKALVDAITMWLIKNPEDFDVIVASNLFGDIITDLASVLQGGMGFAAGGNINPEKTYPSMFEPIHGSAPKYKGKNTVNPVATVMAVKMMLEHLDEFSAANLIEQSVSEVISKGKIKTRDMGGDMKTSEVGDVICKEIRALYSK